jgi:hypothetical protein
MSRRKKNAGEGYGYMFHGSFVKKADAVAKERKTKGAWVKGTLTNKGYRYLVMSPRTNPIKRKKNPKMQVFFDNAIKKFTAALYHPEHGNIYASGFTKKEAAKNLKDRMREIRKSGKVPSHRGYAANPHELLVMGANPHEHHELEITLPPGATVIIRTPRQNPLVNPDRFDWIPTGGIAPGENPRENVELGTYENGIFHPWTRRPKSRQKKAIRRQNSSAAAIREDFTGAPSDYYTVHPEPHMPAGDYAELGKLLVLYVKPIAGGQVQQITFAKPFPIVVSDESARQIWFVDGDQDVSGSIAAFGALDRGAGLFELGEARRIDYKQRKEHVPDPDTDEWKHHFGEENGIRPRLLFDVTHKRLLLEGGDYEIRREGITN